MQNSSENTLKNGEMSDKTRFFRNLSLFSYITLLIWMLIWELFLIEQQANSRVFTLLLYIVPLMLPGWGIIKGKPYTHAWANFIVMFYLLHALTSLYVLDDQWWYALIELILAIGLFIGCSFYARLRGKELGLGIKKLKLEMAEEKARFEEK